MGIVSHVLKTFQERFNSPIVFGFSCCLAWFFLALRAMILHAGSLEPITFHVPFYLFMTGGASIALILGGVFPAKLNGLLSTKAMRFIPATTVAIATLVILLASLASITAEALLAGILGVVAGMGFGIFFFQWRKLWVDLEFKDIVFNAVIAWCMCEVIFFFILSFDQLVAAICTVFLPLISLGLFTYAQKTLVPVPPFGSKSMRVRRTMVVRLACLGFIFSFVNEFVRLTYVQRNVTASEAMPLLATNGLSLGILLMVATACIIVPILRNRDIRFEVPYRILLILSVMGVLFLLLPENPSTISYAINMAAYLCLGITFWAATIGLCRKHPLSGVTVFGIIQASWMAGPLVSAQANHELFEAALLSDTAVIVVVGVCALVLVYCFIFRESDIVETTMEGRTSEFLEKCAQVSWRYRLSDRESEILVYFAKGRDIAWIQAALCLSKSTVSTHRQHIYEKLGIHTKQELIDLVESVDEI